MAVKDAYKVPSSLSRSFLDHEIALAGSGLSLSPMPLKQLLFYLGGLLVLLWSSTSTFIAAAGGWPVFFFVVWGLWVVFFLGSLTRTRELRIRTVPAFWDYLPRAARRVTCRRTSDPGGFASIAGIDGVDEDGLISFADGSLGQGYLVVGSASYLLFAEDRTAILNRVDAFWRKVDTTCEYIFVTMREPQRVHRQIAHLERRRRALPVADRELLELQEEQYDILTGYVGGRFTSLHQYLILKATTTDALRRGHQLLRAEVEGSRLMIKSAAVLDQGETYRMLRVFYQGLSDHPSSS